MTFNKWKKKHLKKGLLNLNDKKMNKFKKRFLAQKTEVDRIIKESSEILDLNFYKWIII